MQDFPLAAVRVRRLSPALGVLVLSSISLFLVPPDEKY